MSNALEITQGGTSQTTAPGARKALGLEIGVAVEAWDAGLDALAAFNTNGIIVQTANDTYAGRTLTAPAAGITITNPAGTAGNPTFALANDLAALEGLAANGIVTRTATDTMTVRTLQQPAAGLTITNPAGIVGDPTFVLANDLGAIEALNSNAILARTGTDTWAARTITGTSPISITNGSGVAGNPTIALLATTTNDDASAGQFGEIISAQVLLASAVALTTGVTGAITSISLTAGDWDVRGDVSYVTPATTSVTRVIGSITQTNGVLDLVSNSSANGHTFAAVVPGVSNNAWKLPIGPTRISLASTTTVYLVAFGVFTVAALSAYGSIVARRAR